jgi:hypothetical protein
MTEAHKRANWVGRHRIRSAKRDVQEISSPVARFVQQRHPRYQTVPIDPISPDPAQLLTHASKALEDFESAGRVRN